MASLSHKSAHAKLMADKNRLQQGIGLKTTNFHFIRLGSLMFFLCSGLPMWLVCRGKFTEYAFHIFLEFQINLIFFFFWKGIHFIFTLKQVKRWISLVAQTIKNQPIVQEAWISSLGREDPLEEDGNPLQYSCLENPMDGGACRATVHGGHKESDTTEWLTHTHTSKEMNYSRNKNSPYLKNQAWESKTLSVLVNYSGLVSGSPGVCFPFSSCQVFLNEALRSSSLSRYFSWSGI